MAIAREEIFGSVIDAAGNAEALDNALASLARDNGVAAIDQYVQTKTVWLRVKSTG